MWHCFYASTPVTTRALLALSRQNLEAVSSKLPQMDITFLWKWFMMNSQREFHFSFSFYTNVHLDSQKKWLEFYVSKVKITVISQNTLFYCSSQIHTLIATQFHTDIYEERLGIFYEQNGIRSTLLWHHNVLQMHSWPLVSPVAQQGEIVTIFPATWLVGGDTQPQVSNSSFFFFFFSWMTTLKEQEPQPFLYHREFISFLEKHTFLLLFFFSGSSLQTIPVTL